MKLHDFLTERPLSNKEKGKKEKIVKGMKGAKGDFEKRYGKDAKSVMYATATKLAKNESLQALARHVKEGVPLPDSLFRYQSEAYFDTFKQAKQLREAGALPELDWESEEMLATDIGESVVLKGVGRVWLDVPYLDEGKLKENTKDPMSKGDCETCKGTGLKDDDTCPVCDGDGEDPGFGGTKSLEKPKPRNENIVYEDEKSGEAMVAKLLAKALGDENRWSEMSAQELYSELESQNPELADTINDIGRILYGVRMQESSDSTAMKQGVDAYNKQNPNQDKEICPLCDGSGKWENKECPSCEGHGVFEAEYNGKDVELNKPKRGGSKKYYVYVKNPKTDRVKKISFGDVTGLRTKSGNAKRAKSFAARHNCEKKNDKMKAGYWACRLPRYGLVKGGKWW